MSSPLGLGHPERGREAARCGASALTRPSAGFGALSQLVVPVRSVCCLSPPLAAGCKEAGPTSGFLLLCLVLGQRLTH